MKAAVILVAAGKGARFGAARPKQFLPLGGKPLLYWPLKAFERTPDVSAVVLVVAAPFVGWARRFILKEKLRKVTSVVAGGAERADSVRCGVAAAPPEADVVLVHDAARALVTPEIVSRVAAAALRRGAALAAWPVPDTLKLAKGPAEKPLVRKTVPRAGLWSAQTPQGFRRDVLDRVFAAKTSRKVTDDVQLAEAAGVPVELALGSPFNFKVTLPEDFIMARRLLVR